MSEGRPFRPFSTRSVSWAVVALLGGRLAWLSLSGVPLSGEVSMTPRRPLDLSAPITSDTEALLHAIALADAQRYEESAAAIKQVLKVDPSAMGYNALGVVDFDLGKTTEALKDFDAAVAADPKSADSLSNRADLRRQLGDLAGAMDDYDSAIALDPVAPGELSYALFSRAQLRIRLAQASAPQAAMQDLQGALDAAPPNWSDRARAEEELLRLKRGEPLQGGTR